MKPSVFIGSSSEALGAATALAQHLRDECDVTLWNQSLFRPSQGFLDTLLKSVERFDFALFVFAADDIVESRGKRAVAPRDNVVFELGMGFGRLGPRRTFAACQAKVGIKIPSDLAGISIPEFELTSPKGDALAAVRPLAEELLKSINESASLGGLRLLPSTALAIGYFENFVVPVCRGGRLTFQGREWNLAKDDFKWTVLIPEEFGPTYHDNLATILHREKLERITVETNSRNFPFYVEATADGTELRLYDIPTTMSVLPRAIRLHLGKSFVGTSAEERILQQREISNFEQVLLQLRDEPEHMRLRNIVEIRRLS